MNTPNSLKIKCETRNMKQIQMNEIRNSKRYDLEDRSLKFAKNIRLFVRRLKKSMANIEDGKQLIRSSGFVGANYIEANESLSKKDFIMRIKICRKESKESRYWLSLIDISGDKELESDCNRYMNESTELMKIFSSIMRKSVSTVLNI